MTPIIFLFLLSLAACDTTNIFSNTSPVTPITSFNFDKQITGMRVRDVNIVLYFSKDVSSDALSVVRKYEDFAREYGRVFRVFYVNCGIETKLCKDITIASTPIIKVFPPTPAPPFEYKYNTILVEKDLKAVAGEYLPKPDITILTPANIGEYLSDKPNLPKVIMFHNKDTIPFFLKAIAHTFYDTMHIGLTSDSSLAEKYKMTTFPSIMIIRRQNEKPLKYSGELTIAKVTEFINPYSEKFVFGDRKSQMKSETEKIAKPWKKLDLPELYKESAESICFKHSGKDCVIHITKTEPDESIKSIYKALKSKYAKTGKFTYMWLDAEKEKAFFDIFGLEKSELPKVVILKTGSNKRMHIHTGEITEEGISNTFEKIQLGEARFARLNVKEFPELSSREVKEKPAKTDLQQREREEIQRIGL